MTNKMTYSVAIDNAINCGVLDNETVEKLKALKASLAKKSEKKSEKKLSDYDNALRNAIVEMLSDGKPRTCSEMIAEGLPAPDKAVLSTQKVVATVKAVGATVVKTEKGKSYYGFKEDEVEDVTEDIAD